MPRITPLPKPNKSSLTIVIIFLMHNAIYFTRSRGKHPSHLLKLKMTNKTIRIVLKQTGH